MGTLIPVMMGIGRDGERAGSVQVARLGERARLGFRADSLAADVILPKYDVGKLMEIAFVGSGVAELGGFVDVGESHGLIAVKGRVRWTDDFLVLNLEAVATRFEFCALLSTDGAKALLRSLDWMMESPPISLRVATIAQLRRVLSTRRV